VRRLIRHERQFQVIDNPIHNGKKAGETEISDFTLDFV